MYNLIIVDDEPQIRKGLSQSFPWSKIGFNVTNCFSNGLEVVDYLSSSKDDIHIILSDIRMPKMNGIELAQYVQKNFPHITMIFLSAYEDFNYAKDAIRFGVKRYIVKPTKYNELLLTFSEIKEELDATLQTTSPEEKPATYYDRILQDVNDYIQNNLRSATLEQAAEVVHMSTHYLSKLYSQHSGTTFSAYLLEKRMEYAAGLLMDYRYKTYEISDLLGYNNPKNFTRSFKKFYGITPREYRIRGIENDNKK